MNNAEKYLLLMLNRRGDFSVLDRASKQIGVLACGLSDLLREEIITLDETSIIKIEQPLSLALESLAPLYDYLADHRQATPEEVVYDYVVRLSEHWETLFQSLGRSLTRQGVVKPTARDSLIKKILYVPERERLDELLWDMKWSLGREAIAPDMLDLWNILRETKQSGFFTTRDERILLKERGQSAGGELARGLFLDYQAKR